MSHGSDQTEGRRRSRRTALAAAGVVVLILAVLLAVRLLSGGGEDAVDPGDASATPTEESSGAPTSDGASTGAPPGESDAPTVAPETSSPTAATDEPSTVTLGQRCESPAGFAVARPVGWFTNDEPAPELCAWFGPAPLEVPSVPGEGVLAAVRLGVQEGVDVATASAPDPGVETVTDRRETTVDGRRAFRLESTTVDSGVFPAGTRTVHWTVEMPPDGDVPRTLLATAFPCCGVELAEAAEVLDAMVASLEISG